MAALYDAVQSAYAQAASGTFVHGLAASWVPREGVAPPPLRDPRWQPAEFFSKTETNYVLWRIFNVQTNTKTKIKM